MVRPDHRLIRLAEIGFVTFMALRAIFTFAPDLAAHPQVALFLTAEIASAVLVLVQRPGEVATGTRAVLFAFIGSGIALSMRRGGTQIASDAVSSILLVTGMTMSLGAKLFLARSFGLVAANRGVRTVGLYRMVRHPMYLGYMINHVGVILIFYQPWNVGVIAAAWALMVLRIIEEEKVLTHDPAYRAYSARVRWRLVPGIF